MPVEPDASLVAACAERDLEHRAIRECRAIGHDELALIPCDDLVLPRLGSGCRLFVLMVGLLGLPMRHMRFDRTRPHRGIGEIVLNGPPLTNPSVFQVKIESPLAV